MGFVKIHRDIQNHWLWTDKPFARGQAWIDLLVMTNYAEGDILSKGNLVHLERGQVFRSIGYLSERWGWNKKKVRKFLEVLERDKMVTTKGLANGTLITIENYARWNDEGSAEGSAEGTSRGHVGVTKGSQKEKNKKKEKNNNTTIKEFVPPTLTDVRAYRDEKNLEYVDADFFYEYYSSNNWLKGNSRNGKQEPMKNWKQTMITWNKREHEKHKQNKPAPINDGLDILFGGKA